MNGTIISHLNYKNNENVRWFYKAPMDGKVHYKISFTVSEMENNYDYLTYSKDWISVPKKCTGTESVCPDDYIESSHGVLFNFYSDKSVTKRGFEMSILYTLPCYMNI
jgi:hypothetical protein